MQALKESKTSRRQPGTGTKPGVPDEEKDITEENVILEWGSEQESEHSKKTNLVTKRRMIKMMMRMMKAMIISIRMRKDEDEEMLNAEVEDSGKGDAEVSDAAKADAEKTEEAKDDSKKVELPPTISTVKDTTDAEINSLLDVKIQSEVPHIHYCTTLPLLSVSTTPLVPQQTTTPIPTPPITIDAPTINAAISESDALSVVQLRVAKLEKDVSELKKMDLSAKALAALKTQVPYVVDNYL
ncbi:hypothetical protein Tco_0582609 [Tanacetum coccineum]